MIVFIKYNTVMYNNFSKQHYGILTLLYAKFVLVTLHNYTTEHIWAYIEEQIGSGDEM